jgi:hypothetical protein
MHGRPFKWKWRLDLGVWQTQLGTRFCEAPSREVSSHLLRCMLAVSSTLLCISLLPQAWLLWLQADVWVFDHCKNFLDKCSPSCSIDANILSYDLLLLQVARWPVQP